MAVSFRSLQQELAPAVYKAVGQAIDLLRPLGAVRLRQLHSQEKTRTGFLTQNIQSLFKNAIGIAQLHPTVAAETEGAAGRAYKLIYSAVQGKVRELMNAHWTLFSQVTVRAIQDDFLTFPGGPLEKPECQACVDISTQEMECIVAQLVSEGVTAAAQRLQEGRCEGPDGAPFAAATIS